MPPEAERIHTAISRWQFAEGNEEKTETEEQKSLYQSSCGKIYLFIYL